MITFLDDYHNIHTKIVPLLWLATSPMTNLLATLVVRCPIYQNAAGQNSWQYTHVWRVTSKHHQRADTISMSSILLSPSLQHNQDSFYLHHQWQNCGFHPKTKCNNCVWQPFSWNKWCISRHGPSWSSMGIALMVQHSSQPGHSNVRC